MSEPCQVAAALYGTVAVLALLLGIGYCGYKIGRSDRTWRAEAPAETGASLPPTEADGGTT